MKFIKYGFSSFSKHILTNILIIFQLTFLFVGFNVVIGNYNSRDILYHPYEEIIKNDGYYWFYFPDEHMFDSDTGEYIKSYDECLDDTLSEIKGEYAIYQMRDTYVNILPKGDDEKYKSIRIVFVDDRIYDRFNLPLVEGKWKKSDSEKPYGVIIKNTHNYGVGDTFDFMGTEITISGVLTNPTYLPSFNGTSDFENGVTMFFNAMKSESALYDYVIMPMASLSEEMYQYTTESGTLLIEFKNSLSKEDKEHNENVLLNSCAMSNIWDFKEIEEKTLIYMKEDFNKTMPLIVCMWIISVVGLVCSSAITTLKLLRSYAVYYMCGAKWNDCLIINIISSLVTVIISAGLTYIILTLGLVNGYAQEAGFVFKLNNVIYTAGLAILMIALSIIVPAIMLKHKQPKTIISEMSE